ncbi:MAG: hypothetical protein M1830_005755, partial [Pleopsidium flavum]
MAHDAPQITLLEKVDIVPALLQTFASAIYGALSAPFRGDTGAPTYYQHVAYSALRTMLARTSIAQSQYINPSTTETYEAFAKQKGFPPESITLEDGTKAHWLGKKTADKVIINFH